MKDHVVAARRGRKPAQAPSMKVDIHVGSRVRFKREGLGMSQTKLADAVGVTFQQVQKYETGANRISASRLFDIGQALGVPVSYFFYGLEGQVEGDSENGASGDDSPIAKGAGQLARYFSKIENPTVRKSIFEMVKTAAELEGHPI